MPDMSTFLCNPSEASLNNMEVFIAYNVIYLKTDQPASFINEKPIKFNTNYKLRAFWTVMTEGLAQELYKIHCLSSLHLVARPHRNLDSPLEPDGPRCFLVYL